MKTPADELMNFALFALGHVADSVIGSNGPLIPVSLVEVDGKRSLARFVGDLEDGQQRARDTAKDTLGVQRAAVAWDGYLTIENIKTDAVFVEASQAGDTHSIILAQRYRPTGRVGNPALVAKGAALF